MSFDSNENWETYIQIQPTFSLFWVIFLFFLFELNRLKGKL